MRTKDRRGSDSSSPESCSRIRSLAASGYYVHALPGRLRVEAPGIRGSRELAAELERSLAAAPGIKKVEARASTGRVLVEFDPCALSQQEVLQAMDRLHCFERWDQDRDQLLSSERANPIRSAIFHPLTGELAKRAFSLVLAELR